MSDKQKQSNVIKPGMLVTDCSLVEQPQGSTRFVLNGVNETDEGDNGNIIREESNETCYTLPDGTTPIGEVYIGDDNRLLFLIDESGNSYICLIDRECNLSTVVTDKNQVAKFNFKVTHQIDALYRLRRGCETVIYWVDPKPRIFILEKPELFQDDAGDWDINKFNLFKTYSSIPVFEDIEVLDEGGSLLAGSYNFSIQYLDEDLNPTEFIAISEVVHIYNDSITDDYIDVRGSTALDTPFQHFESTNKSIKIKLSALDTDFPFYKIAITEANSGSGIITDTKLTSEISTRNPEFTYTGINSEKSITQAEIIINKNIIEKATSIEQIENILTISDTEGKNINYCNLQKYASKIAVDMVTKDIILNEIITDNPKHPTVKIDNVGFQPGEIYSLGIVYIFADNTTSPVYHIPGKNPLVSPTKIYSIGTGVYPMKNIINQSEDNRYIDNNSCDNGSYWGEDIEGTPLTGNVIRHHRLPLRTDVNLPLVQKLNQEENISIIKRIKIVVSGSLTTPILCPEPGESGYDIDCVDEVILPFQIKVTFTINGITDYFITEINPVDWAEDTTPVDITTTLFSDLLVSEDIIIVSIDELTTTLPFSIAANILTTTGTSPKGLDYIVSTIDNVDGSSQELYKSKIFGMKFSNIIIPNEIDTNGNKIIGYYIVRNERTEDEKTILDSAVLTSMLVNKKFVSHAQLMPELEPDVIDNFVKKDVFALINPEFKFNGQKYGTFDIIQQGKFIREEAIHSRVKINDVSDGSGYVRGKHKFGERDRDGWTLQIKTRDNITSFQNSTLINLDTTDVKQVIYLDALADKLTKDSNDNPIDIFNVSCDNKVGIITLNDEITTPIINSVPYVYLYRSNANPYSNFRVTPYFKIVQNPIYFDINGSKSTCEVWGGDSYITPIRYTNSIFYDNRTKKRKGKSSALTIIIGALLVVVAVALAYFTGGASLSLVTTGLALLASAGASMVASGIKQDAWRKAYEQLYKKGLRETIQDLYTDWDGNCVPLSNDACSGYKKNPQDDEIQWLADSVNLWFESKVNMSLRIGSSTGIPDFVNAPSNGELGTSVPEWDREYFGIHSVGSGGNGYGDTDSVDNSILPTTALDFHMLNKLTYLDTLRKSGRGYIGVALPELYLINPDYIRTNKQKIYNHLALEYDCCSECNEKFPHRIHYSLQSFQEELTDNFRVFLPNNYRDLEGNTGRITDVFRIQNKLYIHTEEALWELPQNFQERVTGEIISFIGTGEYFNIPARKIVDDENSSAGNLHKWARIKTRYGVVFLSHKEKKVYYFSDKLKAISDTGNANYFKENMKFRIEEEYYKINRKPYPYIDNPSNILGVGYIMVYDTKKERLIITKKDFTITNLPTGIYELCSEGDSPILFTNMQVIIDTRAEDGWVYVGLENCRMKFAKEILEGEIITTYEVVTTCIENAINPTCTYFISVKFPKEVSEGVDVILLEYRDCEGITISMPPLYPGMTIIVHNCIQIGSLLIIEGGSLSINDLEIITNNQTEGCNINTICTDEIIPSNQEVEQDSTIFEYEDGINLLTEERQIVDNSWTMSYSLKADSWVSWHSYLPSFYMYIQEKFYSWKQGMNTIFRHGVKGSYGNFYGESKPFIIEYVDVDNPLVTKIYDALKIQTEAKTWNEDSQEFLDAGNVTFTKILLYNTHQISGILNMVVKQNEDTYIEDQITNSNTSIVISRNERDWSINDFRDISIDQSVPMFKKDLTSIQNQYYIDKVVNSDRIDFDKNWMELENFRDKFLVVRLIIDTFDSTRLIMNFSIQDSKQSER